MKIVKMDFWKYLALFIILLLIPLFSFPYLMAKGSDQYGRYVLSQIEINEQYRDLEYYLEKRSENVEDLTFDAERHETKLIEVLTSIQLGGRIKDEINANKNNLPGLLQIEKSYYDIIKSSGKNIKKRNDLVSIILLLYPFILILVILGITRFYKFEFQRKSKRI